MLDKTQACPDDFKAITDRLAVLIAREEGCATRRVQILRTRQKEDVEVERTRKREDKQSKERRVAEDVELAEYESELDKEEESWFPYNILQEKSLLSHRNFGENKSALRDVNSSTKPTNRKNSVRLNLYPCRKGRGRGLQQTNLTRLEMNILSRRQRSVPLWILKTPN
jgi:hypothetical protein